MQTRYLIEQDAFSITEQDFLIRLLIAIGIGLIIGLEREHASSREEAEIFAGVRTFVMVVLLGFVAAMLSFHVIWIFVLAFAGVLMMISISYKHDTKQGKMGGTTEFVTMLSFLLGGMTFLGYTTSSLAIMVVIVVLLSLKLQIKSVVGRISQEELYALIRFVVLALLIFPFLPDEKFGPYEVINPREVGWVVVLTSGLSFLGYLLMKFLGSRKGILWTGILGGLVSSTLITWIFSRKSREVQALSKQCAMAIIAASTIMVVRVGVWVKIFNPALLPGMITPLTIMLMAGLFSTLYFYQRQKHESLKAETEVDLGHPLNIRDSLWFGVFFMGILVFITFANNYFGNEGILISSSIAGFSDLDAITISISKLGGISIPAQTAQIAILLATIANTITKFVVSLWFGSRPLKRYALIGYGSILVTGIIGLIWVASSN